MTAPAALLAARVRAAGAPPLLTWYDDSTGERVELSAISLANWAAKTASFLVDELDVEPGERVAVRLPAHWQTAAVLLGLWTVGAVADVSGSPARVAFVYSPAGPVGSDVTVGLALRPMGGRMLHPPAGVLDYAVEVPGQPDVFAGPSVGGDAEALWDGSRSWSGDDLAGAELPDARVLAAAGPLDGPSIAAWLVRPLAGAGSTVLVRDEALDGRAARVAAERITHAVGADGTMAPLA